jgi:hypothetical protein
MLRLTPDQFTNLQTRIKGNVEARARAPRMRNKYGAEPCEIDGRRFDSKAEGRRYLVLKDMARRGEIFDLECQVSFELIPAQVIAGKKERPVRYVCDFRYTRKDGLVVVEDVKSAPTKTREFILKRKLMHMVHGIAVVEVMVDD